MNPLFREDLLDELVKVTDIFRPYEGTALGRLGAALFVNDLEPRSRIMAMFAAYFDASGDGQTQPYIVVSGFVANLQQWLGLDRLWTRAHKEARVDLPFHMADFVAARENPQYASQSNARLDYVRLAKDQQAADLFLRHLTTTVLSTVHCGISALVPMELYNNVSSLLDLRKVVPPYALAARMCIEKLYQWEALFGIGEPTEYIFESGDFEQGKFTDLMIDEGQAVPIYKNKKDFPGLQAADYYAWEQFYAAKKYARQNYVPRESGSLLLWGVPKLHVTPDLSMLINLCHKKGIDPKTGIRK